MTEKKPNHSTGASMLPGLDTLSSLASAFLHQMDSPQGPIKKAKAEALAAAKGNEISPYPDEPEPPFEERLRRARQTPVLRSAFEPVVSGTFAEAYARRAQSSPELIAAGEAAYAAYVSKRDAKISSVRSPAPRTNPAPRANEEGLRPHRRAGQPVPPVNVPATALAADPPHEELPNPPSVPFPDPKALRAHPSAAPPYSDRTVRAAALIVIQDLARQVGAPIPPSSALDAQFSRDVLLASIRHAWGSHLALAEPPAWGASWLSRWNSTCASLEASDEESASWSIEARSSLFSLSSWLNTADPGVDNNPWELPISAIGGGVIPPPPSTVDRSLVTNLQAASDLQAWTAANRAALGDHVSFIRECLSDRLPTFRTSLSSWCPSESFEKAWQEQALDRLAVVEARLALSISVLPLPAVLVASAPRKYRH